MSPNRQVLLVSPHFPPDSTAATHRVRLLAPHLAACGWTPTVLTVDARDYEGHLDPALGSSIPDSVRVRRSRAWPVQLTRAFGVGDLGLRAFTGLRRAAARLLTAERFDAVFITVYPTYPALLGPALKKRFGLKFVLDYQDPWVGEWGRSVGGGLDGSADFKSRASRRLAERFEPRVLAAADGVTAVSRATFEQALARTPAAQPAATAELPIGWDRRDLEFVRSTTASVVPAGDGLVHLSYVGTLLPTGLETLRALFSGLALLNAREPLGSRLRLHFVGTSNERRSDAPARVLPVAREFGVQDLVTEIPGRLDYFDALRVLTDSTAILLLGSRERHYTPSKLYPALLAGRPVLALYHADSPATALLARYGRRPSIRLVAYDDGQPVGGRIDEIACHLRELLNNPVYDASAINKGVLDESSAPVLARRLAGVLDTVSCPR